MYSVLLIVHSWLRWIVLALLVASVVRSLRAKRPWLSADSSVRTATVASFDIQLLLGLMLYFVSPMTPRSFAALGMHMKVSQLRFFTIEHIFAMVLAAVVLHVSAARSRRAPDDEQRHRRYGMGALIATLVVLAGIPWPFMPYARPLFRLP